MADGTVKITIEADGNKAIKSAKDLEGVFGQLGKNGKVSPLTDDLDNVAKHSGTAKISIMDLATSIGLVKVASAAFGFVTSGLGEVVKGLNESSATWQTFEGNMKGFGKSGAEIAKVKKALQDYAQQTIYSASDMASTYAQLAAVGTKNTTQLVKGFGGLAAAAEDPQQAMKSLSQQATQMAAKPKVAWEDFKIMLEQTPAGMSAVAKEMGMSLTDLVSKIQDGSVKTDDFFDAIAKAGTNDTFGKMATQYKTVGEAMDGLAETLTNKLQPSFDRVSKAAIGWVSSFTDSLDNIDFDGMINGVMAAFNGLSEKLFPIFGNLKALFSEALSGIDFSVVYKTLQDGMKPVSALFDGLVAIVNEVVVHILEIFRSMKPAFDQVFNLDAGATFGAAMSNAADMIRAAFTAVITVASSLTNIITSINWVPVFTAAKAAIDLLYKSVKAVSGVLKDAFKSDIFQGLIVGVVAAVAAFKTFATVTAIVTSVATKVTALISVIKNVGAGISILFNAIKSGKEIVAAFNLVLGVNPFVLLGVAIAAVVAGLVYFFAKTQSGQKIWANFTNFLSNAWSSLKDIASNVWTAIVDTFTGAVDGVKNGWSSITSFFSNLWDGIVTSSTAVWSGFTQALSNMWQGTVMVAQTIWGGISTFFTGLWNSIISIATSVWNIFGTSLTTIWQGIVTVAQGVWEMLKAVIMGPILILIDLLTGNWNQLGADLQLIWTSIVTAASTIWNGLVTYFTGILSFIGTYFSTIWNGISAAAIAIWNGIVSAGQAIWNGFVSTLSAIWSGLVNVAISFWNALKNGTISIFNGLVNGSVALWNGLVSGVKSLVISLVSGVVSLWNGLRSSVISIANGIKNGAINAWNGLVSGVRNIVSTVVSVFNGLRNIDLLAAGRAVINGFIKGLTGAWEAGKKFISGIGDWIREHKGPISYDKRLLIPAGNAIMSGLNKGLVDNFSTVKDSIADITEGIANSAVITMPAIEDSAFNKSLKRINNTLNGNRLSAGLSFAGITAESASGVGRGVAPTNSVVNNYGGSSVINNNGGSDDGNNRIYEIHIHSEINGREVAKGSARFMQAELDKNKVQNLRLEGVR